MSAVRLASADDVDELVRLRAAMFAYWGANPDGPASGMPAQPASTAWHPLARQRLLEGLHAGTRIAAVADDPASPGRLVAAGIAEVLERLPSPGNPTGLLGIVSSMFTEDDHRGRGHGAAIVELLLAELDAHGVILVELYAAPLAAPVYRRAGFTDRPGGAPMRLRLDDRG